MTNDQQWLYLNRPQMLSYLVDANEEYDVMGRGTGKSTGILAPKSRRNALMMPRSVGVFIGETFQQLLTRTLPAVISGWDKWGLIKDVHYVVGKAPPKAWKWREPYEPPLNHKHFISFYNGSGIHLVSQDRPGSSNGLNTDWIMGDEAKYLDIEKFQEETLPTMRANRTKFQHLSYHHSICFTTSMPTAADAKWILKKEEEMNKRQVELILKVAAEVIELEKIQAKKPKDRHVAVKLNKYYKYLHQLRKDCVYYSEASSLENIEILGEAYIRKMKRILPAFIFETEIMNKRPEGIEGGFYPALDLSRHTYNAYNNDYLEGLNYDMAKLQQVDCRMDGDVRPELPLWIAVDWGANINCLCVAQKVGDEVRFVNAMHVKHPEILDDLAEKFCEYYGEHGNRTVNFAFDHTGHTRMANSQYTYAQQFEKILIKRGWNVNVIGKRVAPSHQDKYLAWAKVLREEGNMPRVRFNKSNCKYLLVSMLHAPAKQGTKGIEKDKSSERDDKVAQEEATHYSDTADLMLYATVGDPLHEMPDFVDMRTR